MSEDSLFFTATMAGIYAGQGNYAKAARIYRHLLDREPGDAQIQKALEEMENQIMAQGEDRLGMMVGNWIDLMLNYNKLQTLKKVKSAS